MRSGSSGVARLEKVRRSAFAVSAFSGRNELRRETLQDVRSKHLMQRLRSSTRSGSSGVARLEKVRRSAFAVSAFSGREELRRETTQNARSKHPMQRLTIVNPFRLVRRGTSGESSTFGVRCAALSQSAIVE